MAHGSLAVRTTFHLHLQNTQIHAELKFLATVTPLETANAQFTGLIIPLPQKVCQVVTHPGIEFEDRSSQVNGSIRT
jgi:hypothetical protein